MKMFLCLFVEEAILINKEIHLHKTLKFKENKNVKLKTHAFYEEFPIL